MIKRKIPQNISVVVYSCKGLKPKKYDHCKYFVVFGVGGKKFKTDVIEDFHGSPSFNTEADIAISNPDVDLKFKVSEKTSGDVLGKLVVPMLDLPLVEEDGLFTVKLKNGGKNSDGCGEIVFKAWVNAHKVLEDEIIGAEKKYHKSSLSVGISKLKDKLTLKRNDSNPNLLGRRQTKDNSFPTPPSTFIKSSKAFSSCNDLMALSISSSPCQNMEFDEEDEAEALRPEVSGVSPKEGPIGGGTRLVIRGKNLGVRREDVIGLFVGGANLLSTLEYFTPSKIVCVTKPWKACEGTISIETQSGGKGVCLVKYTYLQPVVVFEDEEDKRSIVGGSLGGGSQSSVGRKGSFGGESGGSDYSSPSTSSSKLKFSNQEIDLSNQPLQQQPPTTTTMGDTFTPPEVTGVSPKEGSYNETTKVVIRGSHLGVDADDLLKIMVCGKDYRHTLEWESASKLVCHVGPVLKPTRGEIVVETVSGGVGFSMVEFKLVDYRRERDAEIKRLMKKNLAKRASLEQDQLLQHLQQLQEDSNVGGRKGVDLDEKVNLNLESSKMDENNKTGSLDSGVGSSVSGFGVAGGSVVGVGVSGSGGVVGSGGRRDSNSSGVVDNTYVISSSLTPTTTPSPIFHSLAKDDTFNSSQDSPANSNLRNSVNGNGFNVNAVKPANNRPPVVEIQPMRHKSRKDLEMEELLIIMENKVKLRDREIDDLSQSNRVLREECVRLKSYMEELVSKAMMFCPDILAVNQ